MTTEVRKNFTKLLAGNVSVQIISLCFYPLITRLYSPTEFGKFGVFNSMMQIISIYSFGQLHSALLTQKVGEEHDKIFSLSLVLNFISSTVLFFILLGLFAKGVIDVFYLLLPLAIFCYCVMEIHRNWAIANNLLGVKTIIININRLSSNILKLFGNSATMLVASEIFSNLFASVIFFKFSRKSLVFKGLLSDSIQLLKKYKDYSIFYSFYVLAQVLGSEAITLYLKRHLNTSEVGVFFLANKLFIQTALVVSSTLSYSFSHRLIGNTTQRLAVYKKSLLVYLILFLGAMLLSFVNYTHFVSLFFGDKWFELSKVIKFFIILSPMKIVVGFFAYIILLSGHIKFISIFKFLQFLVLLMILQTGFVNLTEFLWIFIPMELIGDTVFIFWGYALVKRVK